MFRAGVFESQYPCGFQAQVWGLTRRREPAPKQPTNAQIAYFQSKNETKYVKQNFFETSCKQSQALPLGPDIQKYRHSAIDQCTSPNHTPRSEFRITPEFQRGTGRLQHANFQGFLLDHSQKIFVKKAIQPHNHLAKHLRRSEQFLIIFSVFIFLRWLDPSRHPPADKGLKNRICRLGDTSDHKIKQSYPSHLQESLMAEFSANRLKPAAFPAC